jgi:hypothetical protein
METDDQIEQQQQKGDSSHLPMDRAKKRVPVGERERERLWVACGEEEICVSGSFRAVPPWRW